MLSVLEDMLDAAEALLPTNQSERVPNTIKDKLQKK
jgi:hypothetical protein